jgi:hypothetical protein
MLDLQSVVLPLVTRDRNVFLDRESKARIRKIEFDRRYSYRAQTAGRYRLGMAPATDSRAEVLTIYECGEVEADAGAVTP